MVQATHQLEVSMERVRRARELLTEEGSYLTETRQEMEQDPRIERVRRARELLDAEHHRWEHVQRHNAASPTTDD